MVPWPNLMMGLFFIFVALWALYGIFSLVRTHERNRKYLEAASREQPLQLDHLSRPLRRLGEDTRLLRISLEGPVRDISSFLDGDINRSADDMEGLDNVLMNISRQLTEWVMTVEGLDESDQTKLADLGLSSEQIRAALTDEGWSFERRNLERPGRPGMDVRLKGIIAELLRLESGLQAGHNPYR
jgi:uncharacterized protein YjiS (DUF1127 family)